VSRATLKRQKVQEIIPGGFPGTGGASHIFRNRESNGWPSENSKAYAPPFDVSWALYNGLQLLCAKWCHCVHEGLMRGLRWFGRETRVIVTPSKGGHLSLLVTRDRHPAEVHQCRLTRAMWRTLALLHKRRLFVAVMYEGKESA
jgi:hypothetical protein